MARIRTIKPEWLDDETLASCGDTARMVSVALITLADDYGNGRAHPAYLASRIWPYDEDVAAVSRKLAASLGELADAGYVAFYTCKKQRYFHIINWSRHQRVDNAGKPHVPSPQDGTPCDAAGNGGSAENSPRVSAGSRLDLDHDQDQEQDRAGEPAAAAAAPLPPVPDPDDDDPGAYPPHPDGKARVTSQDAHEVYVRLSCRTYPLSAHAKAFRAIAAQANDDDDPADALAAATRHFLRIDGWAMGAGNAVSRPKHLAEHFHRELAEGRGAKPPQRAGHVDPPKPSYHQLADLSDHDDPGNSIPAPPEARNRFRKRGQA